MRVLLLCNLLYVYNKLTASTHAHLLLLWIDQLSMQVFILEIYELLFVNSAIPPLCVRKLTKVAIARLYELLQGLILINNSVPYHSRDNIICLPTLRDTHSCTDGSPHTD